MIPFHLRRAVLDLSHHRLLNGITVLTITLSFLIVGGLGLLLSNARELVATWKTGIRMMAYLQPETTESDRETTRRRLLETPGVQEVRFISKAEAMDILKAALKRQDALLENLRENPLPEAFELRLSPALPGWDRVERLAESVAALPAVSDVEYGQRTVGRMGRLIDLFQVIGHAFAGIFFLAAVFIVSNTLRLVLYTRREEIDIMRLVGATDRFISTPFYIEGIVLGALGGSAGLLLIYLVYRLLGTNLGSGLAAEWVRFRFLSPGVCLALLACSMAVGWIGCYFSLRQFLKDPFSS